MTFICFYLYFRDQTGKTRDRDVVLLHGVHSSSDEFREPGGLIDFIEEDDRSPYRTAYFYTYPWGEPITENATELVAMIKALSKSGKLAGSFDIIAHSMGGIVARWAIENPMAVSGGSIASQVNHLFMLATPNWGVPISSIKRFLASKILPPGPLQLTVKCFYG